MRFERSNHLSIATVCFLFFIGCAIPALAQQTIKGDQDRPAGGRSQAAAYTNSMEVLDDKRILKIGDQISMRVVEDREPPVTLYVTDSGEVEVPLIGRVHAAGKTCKQLAFAMKVPLEKDYYYKATVIVALDANSLTSPGIVYVTGQVHSQGPINIPANETFTLSRAILRAGGFADFANRRRVRLTRKAGTGEQTFYVNVDEIVNKGKIDKDPVLQDGDTINVPERLINF